MEVSDEKSSLNTNTRIEINCVEKSPLKVNVKIERKSVDVTESEIDLLYADHVIKEEMVIGPEVLQNPIYTSSCSKDEPLYKIPKLEKETAKEIGTEQEITVSDADILLHKKSRLQKQEETTDRQENTSYYTEVEITSNIDSKIEASTYYIQIKQEDEIQRVTEKSKPSNRIDTHVKTQLKDENVNRVTSYIVFTCNDCGEHFKRKRELMEHVESHEKIKHKVYLKCEECTYQTVTRDLLERHSVLHDKSRRFVCVVCGYRFKSKSKLKTHLKNIHSGKRIRGICDFRTKSTRKINLTNDMKIHKDVKTFSCTVCEYRCTEKSSLKTHMMTHTGVKPFSCNMCEYRCTKNSHLMTHVKIHTGEKPFTCPICDFRCTERSNLRRHIMIHTGIKPLSCTVCEYRCIQKTDLTYHMRIHTGDKQFSCPVCEHRYTRKGQLINHMKIHTGDKQFSCTVCEYRCAQKGSLTKHTMIHTGQKPFSCTFCEFRCIEKSSLTRHMKTHTGDKQFFCAVCEYRCIQKSNLMKHMKIHTGQKPFSCTQCKYRCTEKSRLTKHMNVHTGRKPFS